MSPDVVGALGAPTTWLLTYGLHSTALLLGAWVVTRLVRLPPSGRELVWRFALLGGVVTATGALLTAERSTGESVEPRITVDADLTRSARVRTGTSGSNALHPAVRIAGVGSLPDSLSNALLPIVRIAALGSRPDSLPGLRERQAGERRLIHAEGARLVHWSTAGGAPAGGAEGFTPGPECGALLEAGPGAAIEPWLRRVRDACAEGGGSAWSAALTLLWLSGATWGLFRLLFGHRALQDLASAVTPAGPRSAGLLRVLGGDVPVVTSPDLPAPCVLPGSTVGLPTRCEDELTDAELGAVLAHELAHVRRRDAAWSAGLRIVAAALWLQPLNRLGMRRAMEAAEHACDDWALARTDERVGLATSIARVAEWMRESAVAPVPLAFVGRDQGAVAARVRRILTGTPTTHRRWKGLAAAALIAFPLPLLPALPAQSGPHAALLVQERIVGAPVAGPDEAEVDSLVAHVVIARLRTG